ncbi:MAG TPA: tetratricopeptide repeat protein [Acidobacteriaceae bacterium]|nr:tetratricopeptide repeat protein [Acidobacteriaceae bacterium]
MRTYRRTRARLQAELGVEPGPYLSGLYERILRQDPRLNLPAGSSVSATAASRTQEGTPNPGVPDAEHPHSPDQAPPDTSRTPSVPSEFCTGLPPESACFQGRDAELAEAISHVRGEVQNISQPAVCVVSGMAGVGKTALVVRVAHTVTGGFPDGCLFLDLHGYTSSVTPLSSGDALDRMLRRLGLTGEQIPPQLDERVARFRTLLTGRKMLIILDNAISADQVRPLLPATADSRVLITSRHRLLSLDDAHHLPLDVLALPDATTVFISIARAGSLRQDQEVHELVQACGRLPLALRIVAARCREGHPRLIGELTARLKDERLRLGEIEDGERSVMAAFNLSYQALPPQTQRVFTLLGVHPGADWSAHAAATLADLELPHVVRQLERLLNASLVQQDSGGRYRFHDLVGSYAARQAHSVLPEPERSGAIDRLLTWAHDTLTAADTLITPHRYQPLPETGQEHRAGPSLTCYADAYAWVSAEHSNLAQLCHQAVSWHMPSYSWQIAYELRGFYFVSKRWDDWIATHQTALNATLSAGDVAAEAMTRNNLGLALMETGDLDAAEEQFLRARGLFEQLHDEHGVSNAIANQASVLYYRGEYSEALLMNESAYDFYRKSGNDRNAAITLRSIALIEIELERFELAVQHLDSAWRTFVTLSLPLDEAMAMNCLGEAHQRSGNLIEAERWSRRALDRGRSCGSSYEEARAYRNLGTIAVAQGDSRQAAALWRQALSIYSSLHAPEANAVQDSLALLGGSPPGYGTEKVGKRC